MKRNSLLLIALSVLLSVILIPSRAYAEQVVKADDVLAGEELSSAATSTYKLGEQATVEITKDNFSSYATKKSKDTFGLAYGFTTPADGYVSITYSLDGRGPVTFARCFVGDKADFKGKPMGSLPYGSDETRRVGLAKGSHYVVIGGLGNPSASGSSKISLKVEFVEDVSWEHETNASTPIALDTTYHGTFVEERWEGYDYDHDFYELKITEPTEVKISYGKDAEYGDQEDFDHAWNVFLITEDTYKNLGKLGVGELEGSALVSNSSEHGVHWPASLSEDLGTNPVQLDKGTYYVVAAKRHLAGDAEKEAPYHLMVTTDLSEAPKGTGSKGSARTR